jgi:N-acetylglucosamine-6-phosphate deacetylase
LQGYVDIQVNGYAGVSFNAEPLTDEQFQHVVARLQAGGVRAILPTVITGDLGEMAARLSRLRKLIEQSSLTRKLMPAFHIEGPCLSPLEGYRGAHQPQFMRPASREVIEPLLEAAGGPQNVAMVTIAPEHDKHMTATRWLTELGIIVCAGHTDAPREVWCEAYQAGLKFYTHLGNGSAAMMDRHNNVINRALSVDGIRGSLIPDGHHLPFWLVRMWIKAFGRERFVFTTDTTSGADTPAGFVMRAGRELVHVGHGPVVRLSGTPYLAGSAITMQQGYDFAIRHIGLSESDAKALCCDQPAKLIAKWLNS